MKIALVHDYIKEYGGAERVLRVLSDLYPDAPIYTAFQVKNSAAGKAFQDRKIYESFLAPILKVGKLYSPLRFLTPAIWQTMDLSEYDIVITSASWYVARGFKIGKNTKVICYCHTPPRWLYGYETSVGFTKYWPVRVYAAIVGHFMRIYDFKTAQEPDRVKRNGIKNTKIFSGVDVFIANSINVKERIKKFYRREATVIYPPVEAERIRVAVKGPKKEKQENYFLIVSRLVGAKGLEEAVKAFKDTDYKLKIVGEAAGFSEVAANLEKLSGGNIELLGRVDDQKLYKLYAEALGFIALAKDEDFGMTVVEAQAAGTPVIAFNGGGFKESIIDGKTGILVNDVNTRTIRDAVNRVVNKKWDRKVIQKNAQMFSKEVFVQKIAKIVETYPKAK